MCVPEFVESIPQGQQVQDIQMAGCEALRKTRGKATFLTERLYSILDSESCFWIAHPESIDL